MARDVIFRLKVEDHAGNKAEVSRFVNETTKAQKRVEDAGVKSAQRIAAERQKAVDRQIAEEQKKRQQLETWYQGVRTKSAQMDFQAGLRERQKDTESRKQEEQKFLDWRAKVRRNSFQLEARENQRLRREEQRELERELRTSYRQQRLAQAQERRHDAITNRVARGAVGAIGSIGGLIGGDTGSRLANFALGGHVALETYERGKGVVGAIGALRNPALAPGSNAAVAAGAGVGAAGAAAIIAWLPALAMAIKGATIAIKGSESSASIFRGGKLLDARQGGTLGGAFGEGIAGSSANLFNLLSRNSSDTQLNEAATNKDGGGLFSFGGASESQANLELSKRRLTKQQAALTVRAQARANILGLGGQIGVSTYDARAYRGADLGPAGIGTAETLGAGSVGGSSAFFNARSLREYTRQFGDIRRQAGLSRMELGARSRQNDYGRPALENQLRSDLSARDTVGSSDPAMRQQIEQRIAETAKRLTEIHREDQRITTEAAQVRLNAAKQEYDIRKQMADEAKETYETDAEKFLFASPEERARIRSISQKMDEGQDLTRSEILSAKGYGITSEYARKQAVKMAEEAGFGSDIFSGAKAEKDRLRTDAEKAKTELNKSQIELDNRFKIDINVKSDETFQATFMKEFAPKLQEIEKASNDKINKLREDFEKALNKFANNSRTPGVR
jgi:hypothetical protein